MLTDFVVLTFPWEADCSAGRQIAHILWISTVQYRIHKRQPLVPVRTFRDSRPRVVNFLRRGDLIHHFLIDSLTGGL
jgi:hypothetical protein